MTWLHHPHKHLIAVIIPDKLLVRLLLTYTESTLVFTIYGRYGT